MQEKIKGKKKPEATPSEIILRYDIQFSRR